MSADRYSGKPFLRLLDSYVLQAIGELSDGHLEVLRVMEPKLHQVFGMGGSWNEIVEAQMEFPDHLPEKIRKIWEDGVPKMRALGMEPDPSEFARQFVDTNFPHQV